MDLHRLKVELTNAITAQLAENMKSEEAMTKNYAVSFMESGDEKDRVSYSRSRTKYDSMKLAIELAQRVSRDFSFEEEEEAKKADTQ